MNTVHLSHREPSRRSSLVSILALAGFALATLAAAPRAATAQQTLYVIDGGTTIIKVAPDGTRTTFATGLSYAGPLALDSAGNLYVGTGSASGYGGDVFRYAPDGTQSVFTGYPTIVDPTGLAFDSNGVLYESEYNYDSNNVSTLHKITQGGVVSVFAHAPINQSKEAFDAAGNLYVSDAGADSVTKIAPDGTATTFASGLSDPDGLAFDAGGNLYVSNNGNGTGITVTKITPDGTQSTFATGLSAPAGLAFDQNGNLFVANSAGTTITEITPAGAKSTFASGFTSPGGLVFSAPTAPVITGTPNATASVGAAYSYQIAAVNNPTSYSASGLPAGLTLDPATGIISGTPTAGGAFTISLFATNAFGTGSGILTLGVSPGALQQTLYVVDDGTSSIIKVAPDGTQSTFATGFGGDVAMVFDGAGNLYVGIGSGSGYGGYINRITPDGTISQFAGYPNVADPNGLVFDASGNLFESEYEGDANSPATIHKITPDGTASSFATLKYILAGLGFDSQGNLFVADIGESTVVKIAPDGTQSTFATGVDEPYGLAIDSSDNVYVANNANGFGLTISKITPAGVVTTYATGLQAPAGLTFDAYGNLFVSNNAAHGGGTITEITPAGAKGTFATGFTNPSGLVFTPLPVPAITSDTRASVQPGAAFSYQIVASNNPTSYNATGLPDGLTIDAATGLLSGTPAAPGTFTISLFATNAAGTGSGILTLTVTSGSSTPTPPPSPAPTAAPVITSATTASAQIKLPFTYQITATNGPTSFAATGLPAGLTLDPATGIISGTPTLAGTFPVALSAVNALGTGTASLTLTLIAPTVNVATGGTGAAVEGGANGVVIVTRTGDVSLPLIVTYKAKGNAKAGVDYKPLKGTVTILPGAVKAKIKIKPVNDTVHEGTRVAKVKLKAATDGSYTLGSPAAAKIKIIDND